MVVVYIGKFVNLSTHLFGASRYAFFSSFPAHISAKRYILLGQICARSILHIGRGPSCLHPLLVKAIFEHSLDVPIHLNQFEGDLLYKIKQLESDDNTSLIDANVVPTNDAAKNLLKLEKKGQIYISMKRKLSLNSKCFC